jgi:DNA polymerase-3 subunit beta
MLISVATDGKRLALLEKPIDKFEGSEGDVVFHSRVANEIQRIMTKDGNTEIEIGEKIIKFKMGETSLTSKILEGNFPNYRQIIPTSFSKKIEINKDEFHISLRRIMNVISESSPLVTLTFSTDKITITANSSDIGEGVETLPIKYSGSDFKLLLNPNNLSDPLKNMNINKFVFQINDGFSPISLLGDEGFLYIMMPVRNK